MFGEVEGEVLSARRLQFFEQPGAVGERMARMLGNALVDERRRILFRETGKHRLAVCRAMQREALADAGQSDEALTARNLIDEHRGPARQNRKVDCFADLLAKGHQVWMKERREVGTDRSGDARS